MQRHNNNTISIRTYVLASTGILLIGVSLGMLWYWSLDEEEENVENVDTEREIEKKKTTEKKENEDIYKSKVEIVADPDDMKQKIVCLNLSNENLRDEGVFLLSKHLALNEESWTEINLKKNGITNSGVKFICNTLSTNNMCNSLNLGYNSIGDEGAIAVAELLKTNRSVEGIALHCNRIGDTGAEAIADALQINSTLIILRMENNSISDDAKKKLEAAWGQRRGRMCV